MDEFLRATIEEAKKSLAEGGIPIGSTLLPCPMCNGAALFYKISVHYLARRET